MNSPKIFPLAVTLLCVVTAYHTSGKYSTNAASWFTNSAAPDRTINAFDAVGQLTQRIWLSSNGTTNRTQNLSWDAKGRLWKVVERDSGNSGYDWTAVYDAFDRRLQTTATMVTNGVAITAQAKTIRSYFDPGVEFLEIGLSYDGQATWKLHGPDLNGAYGGMQGVGGVEAVQTGYSEPVILISDARGNVVQQYDTWTKSLTNSSARPTGYGAAPGYEPVALGYGASLGEASAWRGKWKDITGYYWLGKRYYVPQSGTWLSYDSIWNVRDPNRLTFCGDDPINYFDADGRDPAFTFGMPNIFTGLSPQQEVRASRQAAPYVVALGATLATDGLAAPWASTLLGGRAALVARGALAAGTGDAAMQGTQLALGDRQSYSPGQTAVATAVGAGFAYGAGVVGDFISSFRTPLQQQVLNVAQSPQFIARAEAQNFTAAQIAQLPARIESYGENLTHIATGGYADANALQIGRLSLLSSRETAISHELGHVLDDTATAAFGRASQSGFGFSGFYQAESVAYTMQYGFNPAPLTALNAAGQAYPTATRLAVWGAAGAVGSSYAYTFRDELSSLFSGSGNGASTGATLGKKPK